MDVTKKIREIDEKTLPPRLHAVLKRANRRIRRILFFRGMISFLVAGLIVLLTLMAIDAGLERLRHAVLEKGPDDDC